MQFQELNKVAMVVLGSLTLFFGVRVLIDEIFEEHPPEKPGFEVPIAEEPETAPGEPEAPKVQLAALLAEGDAAAGEGVAKRCVACHSFEQGAAHKIGPNLYGIVGHEIAAHDGYAYSPALHGLDGVWDYEKLDAFIAKPQGFAPGTKMAFAGVPNAEQRANLLLYLRSLSDSPEPLPEPEETAAAPAEEPAAEIASPEAAPQAAQTPAPDLEAPADRPAPAPEAPVKAEPESEEAAPDTDKEASLDARLQAADAGAGEAAAVETCAPCHAFEAGAAEMIGPNLHGVVGRPLASLEGFAYSEALKQKDGAWDEAQLDAFLADPEGFAPGNNMPIPGIEDGTKRAALIAFLKTLGDGQEQSSVD